MATADARGNTSLHIAAGRGQYEECVRLLTAAAESGVVEMLQAENAAGLRPVDLALNIIEQHFLGSGEIEAYEKVISYLGELEMKTTGRERYVFVRDLYDVSWLFGASADITDKKDIFL